MTEGGYLVARVLRPASEAEACYGLATLWLGRARTTVQRAEEAQSAGDQARLRQLAELHRRYLAEGLQWADRSAAAGADPTKNAMLRAELHSDGGRPREALALWDQVLATPAGLDMAYLWLRRCHCLQALGSDAELLESRLIACSWRTRLAEGKFGMELLAHARANLHEAESPGLAVVALELGGRLRGDTEAQEEAHRVAANLALAGGREGDLASWVLLQAGERPELPQEDRPTAVLVRVRASLDPALRAELAAARKDRLVDAVVRLDPALAQLAGE